MTTYNQLNRTYSVGRAAEQRPYIPSFATRALGISGLVQDPRPVANPGRFIGNGELPGASNGGAIRLGGQQAGIDFVAVEGDSKKAYLLPADKDDIEVKNPEFNRGRIRKPGWAVITVGELAIVAGEIIDNEFYAEQALQNGATVSNLRNGLYAVQYGFAPRGIIQEIDTSSAVTTVKWLPS